MAGNKKLAGLIDLVSNFPESARQRLIAFDLSN
jgi:hypothetical protein